LKSPDILILQEIQDDSGSENDGTTSAEKTLTEITQRIIEAHGPSYSFIDAVPQNDTSGGAAGGNIRTVILYRVDRGLKSTAASFELPKQNLSAFSNSRIPIVAQFTFEGQVINVIGVHLVSNNANSPLFGSQQPISQPDQGKRVSQAKWLTAFAHDLESKYPNSLILLAGDFNDTSDSMTLQTLQKSGFENLAQQIPVSERYSILFEGNAYLYDQILLKNNSAFIVTKASVVHLNTWLNDKQQTSDHDPFVADLTIK
jgi:predicted extracellular nuclease